MNLWRIVAVIKFKAITEKDWQLVTPTIFPDGTSQIWNLNIDVKNYRPDYTILWNFESESELIQIAQLIDLLSKHGVVKGLNIPYFPYARQDKEISNKLTFAKKTFVRFLNSLAVDNILTYDIHSESPYDYPKIINKKPVHIHKAIKDFEPTCLFFPDEGALKRYSGMFIEDNSSQFNLLAKMYGTKIRNQQTGEITNYDIRKHKHFLDGERVLIIDDICDGGATFIKAAEELQKLGVKDIGLCVSHGIFSKFLTPLFGAGISKIYTTDSYPTKRALCDDASLTIYKLEELE